VQKVRRDFLSSGRGFAAGRWFYLDNAATSQKPQVVIDAMRRYYERDNANIHRGVHFLCRTCDGRVRRGAEEDAIVPQHADASEIIFVRGATEAINLVAQTYGRTTSRATKCSSPPWSITQHRALADPVRREGRKAAGCADQRQWRVAAQDFENLLGPRTKIVAVTHISTRWARSILSSALSKWHIAGTSRC